MRIELDGVGIDVPDGWEGELSHADRDAPAGLSLQSSSSRRVVAHLANFAMPIERGDYGSGAVELMDSGAIFISLLEFARSPHATGLFSGRALPTRISGADFSPDQLQRRLPGQGGLQKWFTVGERRFVLYVVIGAYRRRDVLAPEASRLLRRIDIG